MAQWNFYPAALNTTLIAFGQAEHLKMAELAVCI